jgi:ADP-heptose:LPS heptosyltransferase
VAETLGVEPVFIAGPGEDVTPFRRYRTISGAPLSDIKDLLAGAALFLGNDSGPAHMAAALGVPVLVLFGPSDADVWRPWKAVSETLAGAGGDIRNIPVDQVLAALARLRVPA